jgi:hypothetical protein
VYDHIVHAQQTLHFLVNIVKDSVPLSHPGLVSVRVFHHFLLVLLLLPFQNDLLPLKPRTLQRQLVSLYIQLDLPFIQLSLRHMSVFDCINFLLELQIVCPRLLQLIFESARLLLQLSIKLNLFRLHLLNLRPQLVHPLLLRRIFFNQSHIFVLQLLWYRLDRFVGRLLQIGL